jgi:translation initiation factor 4B
VFLLCLIDSEPARERPKLNLAPRSKPEDGNDEPSANAAAPASSGSGASIFGGAKPVDTLARELEIEERLAKQRAAQVPK